MLFLSLSFFSVLFFPSSAQQSIELSSIKGGNVKNTIDITSPSALFVSAHSDDSALLKQIFVETADGHIDSIDVLRHRKQSANSGLLQPFPVSTATYVTTPLTDIQLASLTGFIYVISTKQFNSPSFLVYEVDQSQTIQVDRNVIGNSTIVFLNSNRQTSPRSSSTISGWLQSQDSIVKMYKGIPTDDVEVDSTQIFSNPVQMLDKKFVFYPTVQKLSLSLETFYIRIYMDIRFTIEPRYFDIDGTGTSSYNATGFYMKSVNQLARKVTVICARDTRFNGTTGANIIGSLPSEKGTVTVQENDGGQSNSITVTPVDGILAWRTYTIGQNITISSKEASGGEYFVQYYVAQDQQVNTFPNSQTTESPPTTTRGSASLSFAFVLLSGLANVLLH